jgi:hypothetical protein
MRVPGFIFGSYESQAVTADQEKTVNWYPEPMESPGATAHAALYPTPGVETLATGVSNPGRAHFFENDREFAVIGTILYEIDSIGTLTNRGTVAIDTQPATICSNGDGGGQLFITSGTNGYYYDLSTNTLTQIAALNGKATMGDFLDGYFLCLDASTSTLYISALLDGSSWTTGTDYAQRSVAPDPWVAMKVLGRFVWLLGEQTSEVWYNAGTAFPLAFHPSGLVRYGCAAPFSVVVADQALYWLGASRFGDGFVLRSKGFTPEIVSNYAVQTVINGYTTISDAQAYAYSDLGHTFYVLNFVAEDSTWALDTKLGPLGWAERGTWIDEDNEFVAWRPRWHARAFGAHRVLDASTGAVYTMSSDLFTDVDSRAIRRVRRAPAIQGENERIYYSSFELDLEPGLGTQTGQGADPQVMMRFSDDGGKTWSNERMRSAGEVGQYGTRVRWNRLGAARRRVFEVSVSDPIPWRLTNAYVELGQRPRAAVSRVGVGG